LVTLTADASRPSAAKARPAPQEVRLLSDTPLDDDDRDVLGFDALADALSELIDSERTATPLTVAISAPWGAGKTTMALMIQRRLANMTAQRNGQRPTLVCWFNAWQHADAPHLGAALAAAVAHEADRHRPLWRRLLNPLPSTLISGRARVRRVLKIALAALAVATVAMLVGPIRHLVTELSLSNVEEDRAARLGPLFITALAVLFLWRRAFTAAEAAARFVQEPATAAALGSMSAARAELGDLIGQARNGGRLVLFIDDLERCPPERALEACEVAGQLLAHEGVVTVLVADMAAIARSAGARYPGPDDARDSDRDAAEAGRRYLEKLVQIQITLPPPRPQDIDALLRPPVEEPPPAPKPEAAPSPSPARRGRVRAAMLRLGWRPFAAGLVLSIIVFSIDEEPALLVGLPPILLFVFGPFIGGYASIARFLDRRRTKRRLVAINDAIDEVAESAPAEKLEDSVREKVGHAQGARAQEVDALVRQQVRSYLIHESDHLKEVEAYIRRYPPELPRGAKRMLNHARVLTRVAVDRGVLEGGEVSPQHLGKWTVVSERWVDVATYVKRKPTVMRELEHEAQAGTLGDSFRELPTHDLAEVLLREPPLSNLVERLIHFEPGVAPPGTDRP